METEGKSSIGAVGAFEDIALQEDVERRRIVAWHSAALAEHERRLAEIERPVFRAKS